MPPLAPTTTCSPSSYDSLISCSSGPVYGLDRAPHGSARGPAELPGCPRASTTCRTSSVRAGHAGRTGTGSFPDIARRWSSTAGGAGRRPGTRRGRRTHEVEGLGRRPVEAVGLAVRVEHDGDRRAVGEARPGGTTRQGRTRPRTPPTRSATVVRCSAGATTPRTAAGSCAGRGTGRTAGPVARPHPGRARPGPGRRAGDRGRSGAVDQPGCRGVPQRVQPRDQGTPR